jgi:3-oxoacyl-[acyl-carrier-protein] synthase-1
LREGRGGLRSASSFREAGLRCQVAGRPSLEDEPEVDRKFRRFMGEGALYAHHALRKAIADAGLDRGQVSNSATGLVVGSGVGSLARYVEAIDRLREGGIRRFPPYVVPQVMGSSASAGLAIAFGIGGTSYSVSAACASASHAIGQAVDLIRSGRQERMFAGGAEEGEWTSAVTFDAMGALATGWNDRPGAASRPFDVGRSGFVMAGGAAMLVLEELEAARRRGARIYAELAGHGETSGGDMVVPSPEAAAEAMRLACRDAGLASVDYVNAHAISSGPGDLAELQALRLAFGDALPAFSSTKGLTGHSLGAAGAQEAVYCLLMLRDGFVAGCANLDAPDPATSGMPLVRSSAPRALRSVMSNSFGFGGTNSSLVFASAA